MTVEDVFRVIKELNGKRIHPSSPLSETKLSPIGMQMLMARLDKVHGHLSYSVVKTFDLSEMTIHDLVNYVTEAG